MRTYSILFSLLLGGLLFMGCPPSIEPKPEPESLEAMPLDYYVQREMTRQLSMQLSDTSTKWDTETSRKLLAHTATAMVNFEDAFHVFRVIGVKPPPPPPPPCSGCIGPGIILIRPDIDWKAIQILDAKGEVFAGFRLVEDERVSKNLGLLIEPDLKEGMSIPAEGILRVPFGGEFMDIPMNPTQ